MTPTQYRDQVARLAKIDTAKAAEITEKIKDPWFEAQAWAHIIRYADRPLNYSKRAENAATRTKDDYQRSAVKAWEIAALGERDLTEQARKALNKAVKLAISLGEPSRSESLFLLFQAAFKVSTSDAIEVARLTNDAPVSEHWRAKRVREWIDAMLSGKAMPRDFFW